MVPALTLDRVPTLNPDSLMPQVIEAFLASHVPNKKTARGYRRHVIAAMDMMAIERFSELQPIHLMEYRSELMAGPRGLATKAQALISLRSFLEWGAALRGHDLNMDQVKYLLPVPQVKVITPHEIMSDKEVAKYLAAAKAEGKREFAMLVVALGSGVRVAELVHPRKEDATQGRVWAGRCGGRNQADHAGSEGQLQGSPCQAPRQPAQAPGLWVRALFPQ